MYNFFVQIYTHRLLSPVYKREKCLYIYQKRKTTDQVCKILGCLYETVWNYFVALKENPKNSFFPLIFSLFVCTYTCLTRKITCMRVTHLPLTFIQSHVNAQHIMSACYVTLKYICIQKKKNIITIKIHLSIYYYFNIIFYLALTLK